MQLPIKMESLPIAICTKEMTSVKYASSCKWMLCEDLIVIYEWRCPERKIYRRKEIEFDNLPLKIKIMIAEQAIKSPLLKVLEPKVQLMLVLLAVKNKSE